MYSMHALIVVFLLMRLVISIFIAFVTTRHMHGKRNCGVLIVILSFISALYRASSYGELGTFILMDVCLFFSLFLFIASFVFVLHPGSSPGHKKMDPEYWKPKAQEAAKIALQIGRMACKMRTKRAAKVL
eukprot:GEMP01061280.1.p1 GENE.GEMP01061280.1~~GEMP01061280.1.p1  ORF type:complete len:130 (+),score=24.27 GEMP01061280.1:238-627(+)